MPDDREFVMGGGEGRGGSDAWVFADRGGVAVYEHAARGRQFDLSF